MQVVQYFCAAEGEVEYIVFFDMIFNFLVEAAFRGVLWDEIVLFVLGLKDVDDFEDVGWIPFFDELFEYN